MTSDQASGLTPADSIVTGEVRDRAIRIMAEQLSLRTTDITLDASIFQLGGDSLDHLEVVMAVEDEFGVEIPDEDAEKTTTLRAILEYLVEQKTKSRIGLRY